MRRAPVVFGATAAGLAAILGFHSRSGTFSSAQSAPSTSRSSSPSGGSGGSGATTRTTVAPGSSTTTAAPSRAVTSAPPTTAPQAASPRTGTGKLENFGYGQLKVQATVTGGKLTDVRVLTLKTAEPYSQQIAAQVLPMLRSQAEKVQSAKKLYAITGATYTSQAYALSLQSALAQLHFP